MDELSESGWIKVRVEQLLKDIDPLVIKNAVADYFEEFCKNQGFENIDLESDTVGGLIWEIQRTAVASNIHLKIYEFIKQLKR